MNNFKTYLSRITSKKTLAPSAPLASSTKEGTAEAPIQSQKYDVRVADFERCLSGPSIPLHICRMLSFGGIPDTKGLRSVCWKILLGYLPTEKDLWPEVLENRRMEYDKLAASFFINPYDGSNPYENAGDRLREIRIDPLPESSQVNSNAEVIDNPLLVSGVKQQESVWGKFFENNVLHDEITKDVKRTHSGMHFFTQKMDHSNFCTISEEKKIFLRNVKSEFETHQDVMARILFLFAKLNPGVRYVQGMNELLAPLYYVFAQDPDDSFRFYAEADAFYCFTGMMAELKDRFIASLDCSDLGISSCIEEFRDLLRRADPELYLHLERQFVDARYYSLRWFTLLCSQEFRLPDVLRLWDSLFADPFRFEFLRYCCCSMLICIRSQLLSMDYASILQTLQSYPDTDLKDILVGAEDVMYRLTGRQLHFANDELHFANDDVEYKYID